VTGWMKPEDIWFAASWPARTDQASLTGFGKAGDTIRGELTISSISLALMTGAAGAVGDLIHA
jgi:hypothetical protein